MEAIIARAHILFWKEIDLYRKVTEEALGGIYTTHGRTVLLPRVKSKEYCSLGRKTSRGPMQRGTDPNNHKLNKFNIVSATWSLQCGGIQT